MGSARCHRCGPTRGKESSRPERIERAKEEWAQGRFDTVPGDVEEFIPLPETLEKPRRATGAVFYP